MRSLILIPVLMLAACNVDHDEQNGSTTIGIDHNAAENGFEVAANEAQEIGGHIANDVGEAADSVQNEVGDVDVDVDVSRNGDANTN